MPGQFDFSHFPVLTTERLTLRRLTEADAPAIMALFGDPGVMQERKRGAAGADAPGPNYAVLLIDWVSSYRDNGPWGTSFR